MVGKLRRDSAATALPPLESSDQGLPADPQQAGPAADGSRPIGPILKGTCVWTASEPPKLRAPSHHPFPGHAAAFFRGSNFESAPGQSRRQGAGPSQSRPSTPHDGDSDVQRSRPVNLNVICRDDLSGDSNGGRGPTVGGRATRPAGPGTGTLRHPNTSLRRTGEAAAHVREAPRQGGIRTSYSALGCPPQLRATCTFEADDTLCKQ